jgi:hypothetical protein
MGMQASGLLTAELVWRRCCLRAGTQVGAGSSLRISVPKVEKSVAGGLNL